MSLDLHSLRNRYAAGETPSEIMELVCRHISETGVNPVWISHVSRDRVLERAAEVERTGKDNLPLYGVPFAVKDNIDVAGMVTTAGCPAFGYVADTTATVVRHLEQAGAILVGKTNLDQFATGLVGVRSPYGACTSVFDDQYISGGSSSGSAVAVARGLVSFALGTDTAGSGRVPAAFNNLIGVKPTRGSLSTRGVVPACRSLDCVSVFSLTSSDASEIFQVSRGFDSSDPYSNPLASEDAAAPWVGGPFRFGIPRADQLQFFSDSESAGLFEASVRALEGVGGIPVDFDYQPFKDAADLLYSGPWVGERLAALSGFLKLHAEDVHPVVLSIIAGGARYSASDTFLAQYRLEELRRAADAVWDDADLLLLPTTGTTYTVKDIEADPVKLNTDLGYYTNFVNLLDLAAVAVPAGFRKNGLPFGVTLIGKARTDAALLDVSDRLHRLLVDTVGGTTTRLEDLPRSHQASCPGGCTLIAVVGAHLTGQPLNHLLTSRGARLKVGTKSSHRYRLYALQNTSPPKPGLVYAPGFEGPGIELEVWAIPTERFGSFVAEVPAPLGVGTVELEDGSLVKGFICEPFAVKGSEEITQFGGWKSYLSR